MMRAQKNTHGGQRPGAGRPKSADPTKKFSVSARASEYAIIECAAKKTGKTISRYLIDLALKESGSLLGL